MQERQRDEKPLRDELEDVKAEIVTIIGICLGRIERTKQLLDNYREKWRALRRNA